MLHALVPPLKMPYDSPCLIPPSCPSYLSSFPFFPPFFPLPFPSSLSSPARYDCLVSPVNAARGAPCSTPACYATAGYATAGYTTVKCNDSRSVKQLAFNIKITVKRHKILSKTLNQVIMNQLLPCVHKHQYNKHFTLRKEEL